VVSGQGYFPVAQRLRDGSIGVVLRGGAPHVGLGGRLDYVFSRDEGRTWSPPVTIVDSGIDDRNPAFGQAADGALVVGYWHTTDYDEKGRYDPRLNRPVETRVTRSPDGGRRWSPPERLPLAGLEWGSPYGKIVALPDGTLLMAIYGDRASSPGESTVSPGSNQESHLYRSRDGGRTWGDVSCIAAGGYNETALLRMPDGRLLAAVRGIGGDTSVCASTDGGDTWSRPRRLLPENHHPADLLHLGGERVLFAFGYRLPGFGVRAIVSEDGGRTFDPARAVILADDAIDTDCGYPSSVLLDDGRVLTVYYMTGSTLHPAWGVHCAGRIYTV
jgi:hypothetical protein